MTPYPYPPPTPWQPTNLSLVTFSAWAYSPSWNVLFALICTLALVLGYVLWRRYARGFAMQTLLAWFEFLRGMIWLVIADTWIAKRMRNRSPRQARLTPLPPELQQPHPTEGGFNWVVPALLALVVLSILGLLGLGFTIGWLAHSQWG